MRTLETMLIKATLSWILGHACAFCFLDFIINFILIRVEVIPYYGAGTVIALGIPDSVIKNDGNWEGVHSP